MSAERKPITLLPAPPLLLEVQSERMVDLMPALEGAGFLVGQVNAQQNRFKIIDQEKCK